MELTDVYGIAVTIGLILLLYRAIGKTRGYETSIQNQEELEALVKVERDQFFNEMFEGQEFVNKNTKTLEEFVICDEMNWFDIQKLAQLNDIKVEMREGWTQLVLHLMVELDAAGWNRKVGSIKEKFGELRFYAETDRREILDNYTEKSKSICEICGKPGELYEDRWMATRCEEHIRK